MKDFIAEAVMNLARSAQMRKEILEEDGALSKIIAVFLGEPLNTQTKYNTLATLAMFCSGSNSDSNSEAVKIPKNKSITSSEDAKGDSAEEETKDEEDDYTTARKLICSGESLLGVMETLGSDGPGPVFPALRILSHASLNKETLAWWPESCTKAGNKPLINICTYLWSDASKACASEDQGSEAGGDEPGGELLMLWMTAVRLILAALGSGNAQQSASVAAAVGSNACLPGLTSLLWRRSGSAELQHDVLDATAEVLRLYPAAKEGVLGDTRAMGMLLRMCNSEERERAVDAVYALFYKNGRNFAVALGALDFSPLLGLLKDHAADTPHATICKAITLLSYMAYKSMPARAILIKAVDCSVLLGLMNSSLVALKGDDNEEEEDDDEDDEPPPYTEVNKKNKDDESDSKEEDEEEDGDSDTDEDDEEDDDEDKGGYAKLFAAAIVSALFGLDDSDDEKDNDDDGEDNVKWMLEILYNVARFVNNLARSDTFRRLDGVAGNAEAWASALEQSLTKVPLKRGLGKVLGKVLALLATCPTIRETLASKPTLTEKALWLVRRRRMWERLLGLQILRATRQYAAALGVVFSSILALDGKCPNLVKAEALRFVSQAPADELVRCIAEDSSRLAATCSFGLGSISTHPEDTMHMITVCTKVAEDGKTILHTRITIFLLICSSFKKIS